MINALKPFETIKVSWDHFVSHADLLVSYLIMTYEGEMTVNHCKDKQRKKNLLGFVK